MENLDYVPKINPTKLCEMIQLCSVREKNGEYMVAVKRFDGTVEELPLNKIALEEEFEGLKLERSYSSGYIFIQDNKVFLIGTDKKGKIQYQFTGGSPVEDQFKDIFYDDEGILKIKLFLVEDNAVIRTTNRTGVEVTDYYNEVPLVDWALIENMKEDGNKYWRLVLLMHYIVKDYKENLSFNKGTEDVADGKWFDINSLQNLIDNPSDSFIIAPNAFIVSRKALELIK